MKFGVWGGRGAAGVVTQGTGSFGSSCVGYG